MMRRIAVLGLLCGVVACAQPAHAQGFWFGGVGFGAPGFYGPGLYGPAVAPFGFGGIGFAPARYAYPVAPRPVFVARPVISAGVPVYRARPAVQAPLNRASRRIWRNGW